MRDPNPAEEAHVADDLPLCVSCRHRHPHPGRTICDLCAYEGRKFGWD